MALHVKTLKRKSINTKQSKKGRNARPKPLLQQVIGMCTNSEGQLELVTSGGSVDIEGEHWTTEKLADKVFFCLAKKEAEPELVTIPGANNDNCHKDVDLLEQYESSDTLLYRKYIIRAEELASSYSADKANFFVINLSDLDERLQAELLDLQRTKSSIETLSRVLHPAIARVFALASLAWFYDSAREEIEVALQP
jgi:hypothetical protein